MTTHLFDMAAGVLLALAVVWLVDGLRTWRARSASLPPLSEWRQGYDRGWADGLREGRKGQERPGETVRIDGAKRREG